MLLQPGRSGSKSKDNYNITVQADRNVITTRQKNINEVSTFKILKIDK